MQMDYDRPAYVPYSVFLEWSDRFRKELTDAIASENQETRDALDAVRRSVVSRENDSRLARREVIAIRVALFSGVTSLVAIVLSYLNQ